MRFILIATALLLAGCETSPIWYASHPDRRVVRVDGFDVTVVPRGAGRYDALGGLEGLQTNMAAVKARHIRAIEQVSRCRVTGAEFVPSTDISQAVVNCP